MKKIVSLFIAAACAFQVPAQNINPDNDYAGGAGMHSSNRVCDSVATGWVIDANLTGGVLSQTLTQNNMAANYPNAVNTSIANIQYKNGASFGIDVQGGYFFGPGRHFGIGAGIMYMYQMGTLTVNNFHTEYQSTDYFGNTFRQLITSDGPIKESVTTSNMDIPVVFKYKTSFSHHIGFTADAGLLLNVLEQNNYSTSTAFDYEAIYKYVGSEGNVTAVYDNSPTPSSSDLIIARSQYPNVSAAALQQYFGTLRNQGYNVGLGVNPYNNTGSVSYNSMSVGLILHPALNIWLSDNFSVNAGVIYIYQSFSNDASSGYQVTNKVGEYNSLMKDITNSGNNVIGIDAGVRYTFTKHRETPPPPAEEPEVPAAPVEETPAPPAEQESQMEPIDISTPILFELNKTTIRPEFDAVLEEAAKEMKENKGEMLVIHGYTDITGTAAYNRVLSRRRAMAVKNYLHKKGVKSQRMKTVGHGAKNPAASNATAEGRAMNRRVVIKAKNMPQE